MMYLSTLLIDTGTNPDRPRPGRLWLRNLYRVHQRLCMAFPSRSRKDADEEFLRPYDPKDFPEDRYLADKSPSEVGRDVLGHVHAKRNQNSGFLFRVEAQPGGRVVVLVLSALKPDWEYAFHNARYLLAAAPSEPRPITLTLAPGSRFRFRLVANPTKRPPLTKEKWRERKTAGEQIKRPRQQLTWKPGDDPQEVFKGWLERQAQRSGFLLLQASVSQMGYVYIRKGGEGSEGHRLRSVRYEGLLEVTDPEKFRAALAAGIGPAKAFGFGLLSLAPA